MAEIKIEKKSPVWPWVLLALLIIGALVYYFGFRNNEEPEVVPMPPETAVVDSSSAISEFIQYVNEGRTMDLDHNFTNEALSRLTSAINAKAQQSGFDVQADLDKVMEHAERITNDPFETTHATSIRKAADILTDAMQNMQQSKFPNAAAQAVEVRSAANAINPDVLTLDQRDAVKSFFQKSADLLQNMKSP